MAFSWDVFISAITIAEKLLIIFQAYIVLHGHAHSVQTEIQVINVNYFFARKGYHDSLGKTIIMKYKVLTSMNGFLFFTDSFTSLIFICTCSLFSSMTSQSPVRTLNSCRSYYCTSLPYDINTIIIDYFYLPLIMEGT